MPNNRRSDIYEVLEIQEHLCDAQSCFGNDLRIQFVLTIGSSIVNIFALPLSAWLALVVDMWFRIVQDPNGRDGHLQDLDLSWAHPEQQTYDKHLNNSRNKKDLKLPASEGFQEL